MYTLLKGGRVLDIESGLFGKKDILVKDTYIIQVADRISVQGTYEVLDCTNKWIIPGLIDMHVHIKHSFAPFFTAAGVTTVRNTAGSVVELADLMVENPQSIHPRVISADRMIDGPPGLWGDTSPYNLNTDDEGEARREVRRQVEAGADFIKVYGWLEKHVMEAVVDEAERHHKEVSCDLLYSTSVTAIDAANIGIKWNEHCSGVLQAIFPQWSMKAEQHAWDVIDWEHPDEEKIAEVCQVLLDKGVVLCPTMTLFDQMHLLNDYWKPNHPIIQKIAENDGLMKQWHWMLDQQEGLKPLGMQHAYTKKIAYIYHEMGGTVVTGTDTPAGIFTYPGMALHRELMLFVESGFTETEALQAATIHAADALGRNDVGRIQENAVADLVVLNENPIQNIEHTRDIDFVVKGGQVMEYDSIFQQLMTPEQQEEFMNELWRKFEEFQLL